jgi:small subunit ribosomal protein S18
MYEELSMTTTGPRRRGPSAGGGRRRFSTRRKVCQFCADQVRVADYKDIKRLQRFISERGKILPRRRTGVCARHQRGLTTAIKRARHMALLPFVAAHIRG